MSDFLPEGYVTVSDAVARSAAILSPYEWASAVLSRDEDQKLSEHRMAVELVQAGEKIQSVVDQLERDRQRALEKARRAAPFDYSSNRRPTPKATIDRLQAAALANRRSRFLSVVTEKQLDAWYSVQANGTLERIKATAIETEEIQSLFRREDARVVILKAVWRRLRQSLHAGRLVGYAFHDDGRLAEIEPYRWGAPLFDNAFEQTTSRPWLLISEPELDAFLSGRLSEPRIDAALPRPTPSPKPDLQDTTPMLAGKEPLRTGLPGRPSSKHLIVAEFKRRAELGEIEESLAAEGHYLAGWLAELYPHHPPVKPRSAGNAIRSLYQRYRVKNPLK